MKTMKRQLTEEQYQETIKGLDIGSQTREISHGVLVAGLKQSHFVKTLNLTRGAVSQAVTRVWAARAARVPQGFERVSVVLPERQAYIVKEWAKDAEKKLGQLT